MSIIDDITGKTQADAAVDAAQIQSDAALAAADLTAAATQDQIAAQQQAAATQRADLQPFTQFGSSFINPAQQAVAQSQQLFTDPTSIMQNPMFQAIQQQNQTDILQNAAVRGRLGTGGTQTHLQDSALRTGFDVLNQERQAQMANVSMLQNLVNQGQAAAAGQGAAALQTGQGISGALQSGAAGQNAFNTSAAAANAAGTIGAANAQAAGTGNLINLGITGLGAAFGAPTIGAGLGGSGVGASNGLGGTINSPMSFT